MRYCHRYVQPCCYAEREGGREGGRRATSIQSVLKMMSTITTMSNFGFWLSAMQNFRGCLLLSRQNIACTEHAAPLSAMACEQPPIWFGGWAHPFGISLGRDHFLRLVNHVHKRVLRILRKVGQAAAGRAGPPSISLVTIRGIGLRGRGGWKAALLCGPRSVRGAGGPTIAPLPPHAAASIRPRVRTGRGFPPPSRRNAPRLLASTAQEVTEENLTCLPSWGVIR